MTYKVVKEFDSLKKGDLLNNQEDPEVFVYEKETENSYHYVSYSENIIDDLLNEGYLMEVEEEDKSCEDVDVICKVVDEIDRLLEQYQKDNDVVTEKFANNEVPYCAKVEADTVHKNLTKVLNHIKSMLISNE